MLLQEVELVRTTISLSMLGNMWGYQRGLDKEPASTQEIHWGNFQALESFTNKKQKVLTVLRIWGPVLACRLDRADQKADAKEERR